MRRIAVQRDTRNVQVVDRRSCAYALWRLFLLTIAQIQWPPARLRQLTPRGAYWSTSYGRLTCFLAQTPMALASLEALQLMLRARRRWRILPHVKRGPSALEFI